MSKDEVYDHADALWRAEATRLRRAFNDEFSALGARMARAGVMFGSHHIEESGQAASIELSKRGTAIFRAIIAAHATVGDKINRKWSAPRFKAWSSHHIDSEAQELGAHWLGGEGTRWAETRDAYMRHILAARDAEQARAA